MTTRETKKVALYDAGGIILLGEFEIPAKNLGDAINWNGLFFVMNPADFRAAKVPYYQIDMVKISS